VPSPGDRLDRAYREAVDAAGADFFRRLRDYQRLLTNDRTIMSYVKLYPAAGSSGFRSQQARRRRGLGRSRLD
jgi:hypothetical protein